MREWLHRFYRQLQSHSDRPWYPFAIASLAALDHLVIVIPTDGILVSSCLLQPKRWIRMAMAVAIGSTLGAVILAAFIELQGLYFVEVYYPDILTSSAWVWADGFFDRYGLLAVFVVTALPIMQHPILILAGLANTNLWWLTAVVLLGRLVKYLVFAAVAAKAPQYLKRFWGLEEEIKEVEAETLVEEAKEQIEHQAQ